MGEGGIEAIPDAAVEAIRRDGGEVVISYDFRGVDYFFFLGSSTRDVPEDDLTPATCPVLMMVPPAKPPGQRHRSVIVGAILPYECANNWGTGESRTRNQRYRELKERAKDTVLRRICYLVGRWVFPGGGVPAAMGSGYYVARRTLAGEGIDFAARMYAFFRLAVRA